MTHLVWIVLALSVLIFDQDALAQTGREEAACSNSAVIVCENFEDRTVNVNMDLTRAQFKNRGWGVSQVNCSGNNCSSVVPTPAGAPAFLGSKVMRFVTPANSTSGGFFDISFPNSYTQLFVRFYAMWCGPPLCSSSYIWSPVATKHVSFMNEQGIESALFWFPGGSRSMAQFWYNTYNGPGEATSNVRAQNVNGTQSVALNTWYCLELQVKMNSSPSTHDGIIAGWVDGVQRWNYQNQLISTSATPNRMEGWGWYSYWNCDANENCSQSQFNHPQLYRFGDNLLVSTQRIGCLQGGQGDVVPPSMPSGVGAR